MICYVRHDLQHSRSCLWVWSRATWTNIFSTFEYIHTFVLGVGVFFYPSAIFWAMPWSQVSSPLLPPPPPPRRVPSFTIALHSAFPLLVDFHSGMLLTTHALALNVDEYMFVFFHGVDVYLPIIDRCTTSVVQRQIRRT